jgi:hypothetical protein
MVARLTAFERVAVLQSPARTVVVDERIVHPLADFMR